MIIVVWDVTPCSLVFTNFSEEPVATIFSVPLKMEEGRSPETLENIYVTSPKTLIFNKIII
jgi:hypothetical protein